MPKPAAEAQPASPAIEAGSTAARTAVQVAGTAAEAGDAVPRTAAHTAGRPPHDVSPAQRHSETSDASGPVPMHVPVAGGEGAQGQPAGAATKQAAPAPGNQQAPASPTSPGQCLSAPLQLMEGTGIQAACTLPAGGSASELGSVSGTLSKVPASNLPLLYGSAAVHWALVGKQHLLLPQAAGCTARPAGLSAASLICWLIGARSWWCLQVHRLSAVSCSTYLGSSHEWMRYIEMPPLLHGNRWWPSRSSRPLTNTRRLVLAW